MPNTAPHATTVITTTASRPFFRDHPGEPVPEENFWTLWCKGRLTEADTPINPSGLHSIRTNQCPPPPSPHIFFTGRMPFVPPNQQRQSTEGQLLWSEPHKYTNSHTSITLSTHTHISVEPPFSMWNWVSLWVDKLFSERATWTTTWCPKELQ